MDTTTIDTTAIMSDVPLNNPDMITLRRYITAKDEIQYDNVPESLVIIDLTHSNLQQRHAEIRFAKHDTLAELRLRIHQKTGTPPQHQHLQVMEANQVLVEIPPELDDSFKLGYFGILHHGMRVHCLDLNPYSGSAKGAYEDTSLIEKYVMPEEEYNRRQNTLRGWSRKQKEENPDFSLRKHAKEHRELVEAQRAYRQGLALPQGFFVDSSGKVVREEHDIQPTKSLAGSVPEEFGTESIQGISVGQRCQVEPGKRRGTVAWVGEIPQKGGHWVGVVFDEPVGNNDGSIDGVKYFDCAGSRYGGFIRGKNVEVGDFPERDLFDSDEEDEL